MQIYQQCVSPGRQVARATKFFTVAANIFRSSLWNLHRGTQNFEMAVRILENLRTPDLYFRLCAFVEYTGTAVLYVTLLSSGRQLTSKTLHLFRRAVSEVPTLLFPINFFGGGATCKKRGVEVSSCRLTRQTQNVRRIRDTWDITFTFPFLQLVFRTAVVRGQ